MDIHFNAFISYRHHPDDIQVAMQVHRALERYHIPRSLKKKLNVKGPMRLFRDKEELPITSNLNDDIGDALRNSDYLIVICSVHTKESIWVQREIELFLKTHHRSRVLTVLASGEPYDVIPEILLYEDKTDPVTGETVREMVEPLSCDWRIGLRRAKREELPRLAAPLLGCAYDELRQRQRQYRMRRTVTLFSLALAVSVGFSVYVLRNSMIIQRKNVQIQANLEESQRNQSRHLATAAQERLDEGDRLTAIALAMAALPTDETPRPYVPEAELALNDALRIYQENIQTLAVGAVSPGSQAIITDFWVDPACENLYLYDMRKHVTVWDAVTLEKRCTFDHSEELLLELIPADGGLALVKHSTVEGLNGLRCVSADGSVRWQIENCIDMRLSDKNTVLAIIKVDTAQYELQFLRLDSGKQVRDAVDLDLFDIFMTPTCFYTQNIIEGESIIIRYGIVPDVKMCAFDWDTAEYVELSPELADYRQALLIPADMVVALGHGECDVFSGVFDDNRVNSTIRRQISGYSLTDGEKLWQTEITSSVSGTATLNLLPDGQRILCQSGPVFQVLDLQTGQSINRCEAGSSALTVSVGEQYAQAILEDGYVCNYWFDEHYCYEEKSLQSGLYVAQICQGIYFGLQRYDNQVTVYQRTKPATLWDHDYTHAIAITDQRIHGDQWLIQSYSDLYLFDLHTKQVRWAAETPLRELLGFTPDGSRIRFLDGNGYLYDLDSATCELVSTPVSVSDDPIQDSYLKEQILYFVTSGMNEQLEAVAHVHAMNMDRAETASYEIPAKAGEENLYYTVAGQHGAYVWLWESTQCLLWQLDLQTGALELLAEQIAQCPVVAVNTEGTVVAMTALDRVLLMQPGEGQLQTVAMEADVLAGSAHILENDLLVLCDNGYLYRYDLQGALLSRTELTVSETFSRSLLEPDEATGAKVSWQILRDGRLMVNAFNQGNVIDLENWRVCALVPSYYFYKESDNSFICNSDSGIAGYPVYSLQELKQIAEETLGDFTLTQEQKNGYGLS